MLEISDIGQAMNRFPGEKVGMSATNYALAQRFGADDRAISEQNFLQFAGRS